VRIKSFEYHDSVQPGWNFAKVDLEEINLLVGATGSGKTRFLNALFNIGALAATGVSPGAIQGAEPGMRGGLHSGVWTVELQNAGLNYEWQFNAGEISVGRTVIKRELITKTGSTGDAEVLVDRTSDSFTFKGNTLPKLSANTPAIYMLREERDIAPLHYFFSHIKRQSFSEGALIQACNTLIAIPQDVLVEMDANPTLERLYMRLLPLSATLYLLKKYFKEKYDEIIRFYRAIFPHVESCDVVDFRQLRPELPFEGLMPVFIIKERQVSAPITLIDLSSGMQKVLLIATEILLLPVGGAYLIDEYENSLGVNAIDFLPAILADHADKRQFIITTHHPYLINTMPVTTWRVFHRRGSNVVVRSGAGYAERFSKSKQAKFTQLINDPFYAEGGE
jgi:energy-coupling factor transporter ATP-binding protein EcfA2